MSQQFRFLYAQLQNAKDYQSRQNTFDKLVSLIHSEGLENELYEIMQQAMASKNWQELKNIIFLVQEISDPRFVPLLCELLGYEQFDLMEGIADALYDLNSEKAVPYIIKTLMDYNIDEDSGHHLRLKLVEILEFLKTEEAISGLRQLSLNSCSPLVRKETEKSFNAILKKNS